MIFSTLDVIIIIILSIVIGMILMSMHAVRYLEKNFELHTQIYDNKIVFKIYFGRHRVFKKIIKLKNGKVEGIEKCMDHSQE